MDVAVEFDSVTKRYGETVAVNAVSFKIERGTLVTLLGPSGCGKTTTLRMIAGLEMASEGTIHIAGEDVTRRSATERDVSMVFQSYALFPHMSVLENVSYGPRISGASKEEASARAEEGLSLVGLQGFGERLPSALSGGQQQRVALARAMVLRPKVLLFDEPLSNLDARLRRRMREDIRALQQELGFSAVYVTHDQEEAMAVSDEIILMDKAHIVQRGAPRALYESPKTQFVARFIGDANIVDGVIQQSGLQLGGVDFPELGREAQKRDPDQVKVAIRPRAVQLDPPDAEPALEGTVERAVYLGSHMEYILKTELGPIFALDPDLAAPKAQGTQVRVGFSKAGVRVVDP